MDSNTPRTDAAVSQGYRFTTNDGIREYVPAKEMSKLEIELAAVRAELAESKKRDLLYASQISLFPGYAPIDVYINTSGSSSRSMLARVEVGDALYVVRGGQK